MRKKLIISVVVAWALLLSVLLFYSRADREQNDQSEEDVPQVIIGERIFSVELVTTENERARGLSGRDSICSDCGMLFEFSEKGRYSFWMKDMRFPIDIIWIDDNKIVHIEKNVAHELKGALTPGQEANRVLEINAGLAGEMGLAIGDNVDFVW